MVLKSRNGWLGMLFVLGLSKNNHTYSQPKKYSKKIASTSPSTNFWHVSLQFSRSHMLTIIIIQYSKRVPYVWVIEAWTFMKSWTVDGLNFSTQKLLSRLTVLGAPKIMISKTSSLGVTLWDWPNEVFSWNKKRRVFSAVLFLIPEWIGISVG